MEARAGELFLHVRRIIARLAAGCDGHPQIVFLQNPEISTEARVLESRNVGECKAHSRNLDLRLGGGRRGLGI
jgi:hypothetical protein